MCSQCLHPDSLCRTATLLILNAKECGYIPCHQCCRAQHTISMHVHSLQVTVCKLIVLAGMISYPLLTSKPLLCQGTRYAAYVTYVGLFKPAVTLQVPCSCSSTVQKLLPNPRSTISYAGLIEDFALFFQDVDKLGIRGSGHHPQLLQAPDC